MTGFDQEMAELIAQMDRLEWLLWAQVLLSAVLAALVLADNRRGEQESST